VALQETLDGALAWLGKRIGFAEGSAMAYDPDVLLPIGFATGPGAPDFARALLACRNEQLDEDIDKFRALARQATPVAANSRADRKARASTRWAELIEPAGHRHELRIALVDRRGHCWGAVNLLRDGTTGFTERHMATAAAAGAAIAERVAHALVLGHAGTTSSDVGTLWLDDTGRIVSATPSANRWLAGARTEPLESVLAGLAIRTAGGPDPVMVRVRLGGGWVTLHAERLLDADGRHQGIVVVVQPAHPGGVLPLAVAAFGLTPREADVTKEILRGKDTRAASAALGISPYTVQDHLKSVFAKVGVTSRGELAHRLALQLV
jgi:DNA-binding CsgD family transcriptional regulator